MRAELKARYSISELVEMMGLDADKRDSLRRTVRRMGVTLHGSTGARSKAFVYLNEFKTKMPEAWESILDLQSLSSR
jgi:hypothetical protein